MNPDLQSIYSSLNSVYDPQRQAISQQIGNVQQGQTAQLAGLQQQQNTAFQDINDGANARGMAYSGAPIQEQMKYTGGTYLPAVANLQAQTNQNVYGLQSAQNALGAQQTQQASGMYDANRNFNQQQGYYNQQLAQQKQYNDANLALSNSMNQRYASMGSGSSAAPSMNQVLASAFNGYDPTKQGHMANYTEQQIAPQIAGALNIPYAQALKAAYDYRKQVYKQ